MGPNIFCMLDNRKIELTFEITQPKVDVKSKSAYILHCVAFQMSCISNSTNDFVPSILGQKGRESSLN